MKKTALSLIIVAGMVFSSCKKDRVCECIETPGNTTDKFTMKKVTKRQAKANCYDYEYEVMNTKVIVDCTIK
ncbi:MAG: hypothetical protein N3F09_01565 [Bacteroidia bacterium]|nr:hypothetical protein [Bacteroidia bacterium]